MLTELNYFSKSGVQIFNGNNIDVLNSLNIDYQKCIFVSDPPFNIGYHYNNYKDKLKEDDYFNWLA
jgi:hypothetical protein